MNNKRLVALTACLILATVPGISSLILADIASETDTKAEQHFEKANEFHKLGRYDAAITEYETVINLSPNSKIAQNALYWIGQLYFEAGQLNPALSAFMQKYALFSQCGVPILCLKILASAQMGTAVSFPVNSTL